MRDKIRKLSLVNQLRLLLFLYRLRLQELLAPRLVFSRGADPVFFAMLAVALMLSLLGLLPHHPLSIFISFGGGLSFSLIATCIRRARFVHVIGQ